VSRRKIYEIKNLDELRKIEEKIKEAIYGKKL